MVQYLRAYYDRATTPPEAGVMRFIASTEDVARDGMVIAAEGWQLDNFRRNPVFLFSHDYFNRPPIGRVVSVEAKGKQLLADVEFDPGDEFAQSIKRKYEGGFLSAVSVGFDPQSIEPGVNGQPPRVTKADLLDISAVMVPSDPGALKERQKRAFVDLYKEALDELEHDGAVTRQAVIPPHSAPKADENAEWDAAGQMDAVSEEATLRRMHAWVSPDGDAGDKRSYQLPHHNADGQVIWRGVAAAMARLLQADTQIPDADRRGVHRHLAAHYEQFGKEAPEFRSIADLAALGQAEIRGLFLEGEPDLFPEIFADQRAGAVLSKRNADDLANAISLIQGVISRAGTKEDQEQEAERNFMLIHQVLNGGVSGGTNGRG
jgi:hypothetical protein